MPVPQEMNFIVEQARCLFHNKYIFLWGGHPARPEKGY
ncbi:hypothetical protein MicvaDRAFT_4461 [Microcoleus vaginatus FGP-2]|nr:hypothetical protein MicvaDRAFT_4461 [Microcoleus vaginatus FGP-2]